MEAYTPSRTLTLAAVLLGFTIIVAFISSVLTATISQNVVKQKTIKENQAIPTPTRQRSIYLELPADFPKDIPLITGAIVMSAREGKDDWSCVLLTSLSIEEAITFYQKELASNGWKITSRSSAAGLTIFYAAKSAQNAIIAVGRGDGGVTISITILKN